MLLLVLSVLAQFSAACVLDDAYMLVRYADQWLAGGQLRLSPGGSPTYGLTSPGLLMLVAPIRALIPGGPTLTALLASVGGQRASLDSLRLACSQGRWVWGTLHRARRRWRRAGPTVRRLPS